MSKSEERRVKAQTEAATEELQNFSYPTLGGAVIKAKNQKEADKIASKLMQDLKEQDEAAQKAAEAETPEA